MATFDKCRLVTVFDQCLVSLKQAKVAPPDVLGWVESLDEIVEYCASVTDDPESQRGPIRLVHHFACTGGTLVAKCLAAMPNTLVLSEVEPHSRMIQSGERKFSPSDLLTLLRVGSRPSSLRLENDVFLAGLMAIREDCRQRGLRLVLRDHAHSRYCLERPALDTPSLRDLVGKRAENLSILTVRHPLDSYLSLVENTWLHFRPRTLTEYARRYQMFLDAYGKLPTFRYEDLVKDSHRTMVEICERLAIPFNSDFEHNFGVHRLSGDSGRSSDVISIRGRRPVPPELKEEMASSQEFLVLCESLGYETHTD